MDTINVVINDLVNYLESVGVVGGFFLVILESIFPILPLAVFIGMNILAFGNVVGFIVSYIATITGCMASFCLFKFTLNNFVYRVLNQKTKTKIDKLMIKLRNIDFNALVIIHAMPFTPSFLINIAGGLSGMNSKKYFISLLIGKLSIIYFWGYVGKNILSAIKEPIVLLKMLGLVVIAYLISIIIEKIIKVEE